MYFSIAGFNGADWFDGKEDWYGDMFYGHIYLVQPPEYHGTNTFKIGKAGQTYREMKQRWKGYIKTAKEAGINGLDILGLIAVKNTSVSEHEAQNYCKLDERIHFEVLDVEPEEAADIVADLFDRMSSQFEDQGKLQDIDNAIQTFEPGTNVFHYVCHEKKQ